MRVFALALPVPLLLVCAAVIHAQQPQPVQPQGTPITAAAAVNSDASYPGPAMDIRLPAGIWQGPDAVPPDPAGMIEKGTPGNPAMVYFALHHRTGDGISAGDAAIIASRKQDLTRAAAFAGYQLDQPGWWYQQTICPVMQPGSYSQGPGAILLHFARRDDGHLWTFTAIVPRDPSQRVRAIGVAHSSMEQHQYFLSAATTGASVNQGIAPETLRRNLDPMSDWIATGACIAEMGGAYPHIPNEPSLSNDIITAPGPYLQLGLYGDRNVRFTDRVDETHYVVWDEQVAPGGRMQAAHRQQYTVHPPVMLHPREPKTHVMAEGALPKVVIRPYPPSPIDGN